MWHTVVVAVFVSFTSLMLNCDHVESNDRLITSLETISTIDLMDLVIID